MSCLPPYPRATFKFSTGSYSLVAASASSILDKIFEPKSSISPKNLSLTFCFFKSGTCSLIAFTTSFFIASISGFGLDQFSELKAYKVNDAIFCLTDSSTISLTISTPLLCPLLIFREFEIAHLPLPSIIIATCLAMFFCLSFDELAIRLILNF